MNSQISEDEEIIEKCVHKISHNYVDDFIGKFEFELIQRSTYSTFTTRNSVLDDVFKQIERDNIDKYKKILESKKGKQERSNNPYKYRKVNDLNRCMVCDEHLFKEKYSLKRCKYCGMFYVNIEDFTRDEIMDIVKADPIFVMNIRKNNSLNQSGEE